jgi:hypothetical protein
MCPEVYVLLAILVTLIGITAKLFSDARKSRDELSKRCNELGNSVIKIETKLDIYLDHSGFDVPKVNRKIKEHMDELKQNDKPSVGCIHVKELYKKG